MIRVATCALGALSILAAAWLPVACSSHDAPSAPAQAAQKATLTLHVIVPRPSRLPPGGVIGIVGSYNTCTSYENGQQWALAVPGSETAMAAITALAGPQPFLDDDSCQLEIVSIYTTASTSFFDGYASTNQPTPLSVSGVGLATAGAFLPIAVGFTAPLDDGGTGPLAFYANAESDVIDSTGNFAITLVVGDEPTAGSPTATATTVVSGSADSGDVPAPDYSTDFSNLELGDTQDAGVDYSGGTINLDLNTQSGEEYETFPGQDLTGASFQEIDSLFGADANGSETAIPEDGGTVAIPSTALVNLGDTLPETGTIVVQHIDSASDVTTYQVLAITFNPSGS